MAQPSLGVMTLYMNNRKQIEEISFFRKLMVAGQEMGFHIFLFTPENVDHANKKIRGYFYQPASRRWVHKWTRFPDLIFDRCRFQRSPRFRQLRRFRARYPDLAYLNRPMANKWVIYQTLHRSSAVRPHLPETRLAEKTGDVFEFLKKHSIAFYKPVNGTGGRGILKIRKLSSALFRVEGRNLKRKIILPQKVTTAGLRRRLSRWNRTGACIVQQGIDLKLDSGRVHDYRLLMQKNGRGEWEVTGCAGRVGAKNSITSNLHGGGRAMPMEKLLRLWFKSDARLQQIKKRVYRLGHEVVKELEPRFSICELALDIAVDRSGHPWLLEINPKPAREVFKRINEKETYRTSILRPLQYALWLHKNRFEQKTS